MRNVLLFIFVMLAAFTAAAQDKSLFEKHLFIKGSDTIPYRVLLPKDYNPEKKYPLIVFLHGAGERGNDNEKQLVHGSSLFLRDSIREKYPAIIIFPQCPATSYWSNVNIITDPVTKKRSFNFLTESEPTSGMNLLLQLLKQLPHNYKLDKKRWYACGLSMGGMGTFELVRRKPKMFAAAFPICGGANTATAPKLTTPHWWIFHGEKDDVVPPQLSRDMAEALKAQGADVRLTLYPNANHNSWDSAFAEKDLLNWVFSNKK